MPVARRGRSVQGLCLAVLLLLTGAQLLAPAGARAAAAETYVKYYVVAASYGGKPETLREISKRYLATDARAQEILSLNKGRKQPDGGMLTDPDKLRAGWALVLPWDAVGKEVRYGPLPTAAPRATPRPRTTPSPPKAPPSPPAATTSAPPSATPAVTPGPVTCPALKPQPGKRWDWASLRMAPGRAWARSRGAGQVVAVLDTGADAGVPQLSGRVTQGADVMTGGARGDVDCAGSGTAMAGIIAAQPVQGSALTGLAPQAMVLPVRMLGSGPQPEQADAVSAIGVAVSAGATVVALGSQVDLGDAEMVRAIAAAGQRGVVIVVCAPAAAGRDGAGAPASLLRVGGVAGDGVLLAGYQPGSVDVVAPGVDIATVGAGGSGEQMRTGTRYAVAFVAAQAALIRSGYPGLTAAQVVERIKATADRMGSAAPDAAYGWGMINPGLSVTTELSEQERSSTAAAGGSTPAPAGPLVLLAVAAAVIGAGLLAWRMRRRIRVKSRDVR